MNVWSVSADYAGRLQGILRARLARPGADRHAAGTKANAGIGMSGTRLGYSVVDGIALLDASGVLTKRGDFFEEGTATVALTAAVEAAAADQTVRGAVLRVESPGGTSAGIAELADAIYRLRQAKPTAAYIEDVGASAAYWLASQAERVYANRSALVGSIGTYAVVRDWSAAMEGGGVKTHVIRAGALKGAGTMGEKISDELLAELQKIVEGVNAFFLEGVARGRGLSPAVVAKLADGRIHMAEEAKRLGLIDDIGTMADAMAFAARGQPARSAAVSGGSTGRDAKPAGVRSAADERVGAFKQAFPNDADFAVEQLEAKATLAQAKER